MGLVLRRRNGTEKNSLLLLSSTEDEIKVSADSLRVSTDSLGSYKNKNKSRDRLPQIAEAFGRDCRMNPLRSY